MAYPAYAAPGRLDMAALRSELHATCKPKDRDLGMAIASACDTTGRGHFTGVEGLADQVDKHPEDIRRALELLIARRFISMVTSPRHADIEVQWDAVRWM